MVLPFENDPPGRAAYALTLYADSADETVKALLDALSGLLIFTDSLELELARITERAIRAETGQALPESGMSGTGADAKPVVSG